MLRSAGRQIVLTVAFIIAIPILGSGQLPSRDFSPGKAFKLTKEEVCSTGFVNPAKPLKERDLDDVFAAYGQRRESGRQVVHVIPLSLGGTNDKENLWPLPNSREFGPSQKEALDRALLSRVCDGSIDLKTAQNALKQNWMEAYKKYVTP